MKKSKRKICGILVLVFIFSLSISAFADENNTGAMSENPEGTYLYENTTSGTIGENKGSIRQNSGTIGTNSGDVDLNAGSGTIGTNRGTVDSNNGTIESNAGIVKENGYEGTVTNAANGTVTDNNGYVDNTAGGKVTNNYGYEETSKGVFCGVVFLNTDGNDGNVLKQLKEAAETKLNKLFKRSGYRISGYRHFDNYYEEGDDFFVECPDLVVLEWEKVEHAAGIAPYFVGDVTEKSIEMNHNPKSPAAVTEEKIMDTKISADKQKLDAEAYEIDFDAATLDFTVNFSQDFLDTLSPGTHSMTIVVLGYTYIIKFAV